MTTLLLLFLLGARAAAPEIRAANSAELRAAAARAGPGTTILLAPGDYEGGVYLSGLRGAPGKPVVIAAADPARPPRFLGGGEGMHLSGIEHVELRSLRFEGARANGVNIDDGGKGGPPSRRFLLRDVEIRDVGARGNEDGIKLSGAELFRIEGCTVERWGGNGSAVDMVGCREGVVESCRFVHDGGGGGGSGVQMKGGTSEVTVRRCRFENAGSRALNVGGSTALAYFRPPLGKPPHAEARAIVVEGNTIVGSDAAVAFVGVDGAIVRFNTILHPKRWAIRILQETTEPGFVPCRDGQFLRNRVVFRSEEWREGGVNVGGQTDPKSFRFAGNWWFCSDAPARSRPRLPSEEEDGVHGKDPERDPAAKKYGAEALP